MAVLADAVKFIGAVEDQWQLYSDNASDYTLGRPIGHGASSIVYQAEYHPSSDEPISCALKVLDLDSLPINSLRLLQRETQLMSLSKHPNVLRVRGTWIEGHKLYIALRLMRSGSVADVMRYGWPGGVEEEVARCILRQALEGLNYLHINGFIHRDLKAANLLIDDDGTVLLGDLGVAASLHDEESATKSTVTATSEVLSPRSTATVAHSRAGIGKRKSFVGTPCWMAPEVISQKNYDAKADIWSLGITALELAQGRAPRSHDPPYKVLMKTIQDEPPSLDRQGGKFTYSKAFQDVIQNCLTKDPSNRPTAEQLLHTAFFKGSKKKSYLVGALLNGLPPLVERQERCQVASAISHFSMGSWDFSQGTVPSPPSSLLATKGVFDESVFEMEEVGEFVESSEDYRDPALTTTNVPSTDAQTETEDSPQGDSTDEASSSPATSPPSSYPSTSISRTAVEFSRLPPVHTSPTSLSTSPGLWRRLRNMSSRTLLDRERRHQYSLVKGSLGPATNEKRRGADNLRSSVSSKPANRSSPLPR